MAPASGSRWTGRNVYRTISADSRATAQRAFLRNLARGEAYAQEAPTLWDVTFRTAVAQAELEDRERPGAYHRIAFAGPTARCTSRPPAPSCCRPAWRWSPTPTTSATSRCSGRRCATPVFGVEVPVVAHRLAEPDKGSGIAMICTFGDLTDVTWWRELQLPTRAVVGWDGRLLPDAAARRARRAPTPSWPARPCSAPSSGSSSCCGSPATWTASRGRSPTR